MKHNLIQPNSIHSKYQIPPIKIRRLDKTNRIALKEGTHYKKTDLNLFICLYCKGDKIAICSRLNDFRRELKPLESGLEYVYPNDLVLRTF